MPYKSLKELTVYKSSSALNVLSTLNSLKKSSCCYRGTKDTVLGLYSKICRDIVFIKEHKAKGGKGEIEIEGIG
jgi:hypothetical protein